MLNRTKENQPIPWNRNLRQYYFRDEWELYDLKLDPEELRNIAGNDKSKDIFDALKKELRLWLNYTRDPWICAPHGVLEDKGFYKDEPECMPLLNNITYIL